MEKSNSKGKKASLLFEPIVFDNQKADIIICLLFRSCFFLHCHDLG